MLYSEGEEESSKCILHANCVALVILDMGEDPGIFRCKNQGLGGRKLLFPSFRVEQGVGEGKGPR